MFPVILLVTLLYHGVDSNVLDYLSYVDVALLIHSTTTEAPTTTESIDLALGGTPENGFVVDYTAAPYLEFAETNSGECEDDAKNDCTVPKKRKLCNDKVYLSLMKKYCKKTCRFCGDQQNGQPQPVATTTECKEDTTTDCQKPEVRRLCDNAAYHRLMMLKCAKTCGCGTTVNTPSTPSTPTTASTPTTDSTASTPTTPTTPTEGTTDTSASTKSLDDCD
ncbi:unnamed protein product [Bursaphelenchus xylophilus]|uniref:(pine wood nematode) hypothetical protein n=1 Tax=Bursaphelenchus xylophilus TaxID=6326 RepID=A0A1I7S5X5_BURXY|nr:unnamed protein product [Bursaphelenchus xylophilus]CAG9082570.1 unnamed protein product [Bursaphelenchus xylophilus]